MIFLLQVQFVKKDLGGRRIKDSMKSCKLGPIKRFIWFSGNPASCGMFGNPFTSFSRFTCFLIWQQQQLNKNSLKPLRLALLFNPDLWASLGVRDSLRFCSKQWAPGNLRVFWETPEWPLLESQQEACSGGTLQHSIFMVSLSNLDWTFPSLYLTRHLQRLFRKIDSDKLRFFFQSQENWN